MGGSKLTGLPTLLARCEPLVPSVPSFSLVSLLKCSAVCFQFSLGLSGNHSKRRSFLLERSSMSSNRTLFGWESGLTSSHNPSIYFGLLRILSAYTLCNLTIFRSAALFALSSQTSFLFFWYTFVINPLHITNHVNSFISSWYTLTIKKWVTAGYTKSHVAHLWILMAC